MIFFFFGRPRALFMYQVSLTWVSFASEPELQNNTFEVGTGMISLSRSASSITVSMSRTARLLSGGMADASVAAIDIEHFQEQWEPLARCFRQCRAAAVGLGRGSGTATAASSAPGSRTSHSHIR